MAVISQNVRASERRSRQSGGPEIASTNRLFHASILDGQFPSNSRRIRTQWKCRVSLPTKVEVLDAPTLRTRGELTASEEALRFGWASWAIHGLFKKLTDCGEAS